MIEELISVDLIFEIKEVFKFDDPMADIALETIYKKLNPDYIITNSVADRFWENKLRRAEKIGVQLLPFNGNVVYHSSQIINKLQFEH